jgi:LAO/AO transport system kinase
LEYVLSGVSVLFGLRFVEGHADVSLLQLEIAKRTQTDYARGVQLFRPKTDHWVPPVLTCSALTGDGIAGVWEALEKFRDVAEKSGEWERRRAAQRKSWLWKMLNEELAEHFIRHPRVQPLLPRMEADVARGTLTPGAAADWLLAEFEGSIREHPTAGSGSIDAKA